MSTNIKLVTPIGKSYSNKNGVYQEKMDEIWALVPSHGECADVHGELVRHLNRIIYEYLNNEGGNFYNDDIIVTCPKCHGMGDSNEDDDERLDNLCLECMGDGEIELELKGDEVINPFFLDKFNLFLKYIPTAKPTIDEIKDMIISYSAFYSKEKLNVFDRLADEVMYYIINTENQNI